MADKKSAAKAENKPAKKPQAKKPNKVVKYFKDLRSEFKKVVWPSKKTVVNNTCVVIAVAVLSGLAIFGLDTGFSFLWESILTMAG